MIPGSRLKAVPRGAIDPKSMEQPAWLSSVLACAGLLLLGIESGLVLHWPVVVYPLVIGGAELRCTLPALAGLITAAQAHRLAQGWVWSSSVQRLAAGAGLCMSGVALGLGLIAGLLPSAGNAIPVGDPIERGGVRYFATAFPSWGTWPLDYRIFACDTNGIFCVAVAYIQMGSVQPAGFGTGALGTGLYVGAKPVLLLTEAGWICQTGNRLVWVCRS